MNATGNGANGWERLKSGRIRMEVTSFLFQRDGVGGLNQDTDLKPEDVAPIIEHVVRTCGIKVAASPQKPRHGWKVSTLVGFIEANQLPPEPEPKTTP